MTALRVTQLDAATAAGQALATNWGHPAWSDSWARLVAETVLRAAEEAKT